MRSKKQVLRIFLIFMLFSPIIIVLVMETFHVPFLRFILIDLVPVRIAIFIAYIAFIWHLLDLIHRAIYSEMEEEMKKKGIIGKSSWMRALAYGNPTEMSVAVVDDSGKIQALMVRRQGLGNFRHLPQYIGLTIEEARALSEKEANKENVRSELRQKVIEEALDEAEKKLREIHAEQDRIRRLRIPHMEEPADSFWEEEERRREEQ